MCIVANLFIISMFFSYFQYHVYMYYNGVEPRYSTYTHLVNVLINFFLLYFNYEIFT